MNGRGLSIGIAVFALLAAVLAAYFSQQPNSRSALPPLARLETRDGGLSPPASIRGGGEVLPPAIPPSGIRTERPANPYPDAGAPPRTELLKPTRAADAPLPQKVSELTPKGHAPIDRRDHPGPEAASEMEKLSYGLETLDDDIRECLSQWGASAVDPKTEVMIGFEIGPEGLQHSWVENDDQVPFGPRSCLSNAVYGLDWSNIVKQPAKITNRYALDPDAGH